MIHDCLRFNPQRRPNFKEIENRLSKIFRSCQNELEKDETEAEEVGKLKV